jgi:carbonic anhydrase
MAASALTRALHAKMSEDERARVCSQELVRVSFENLMTYSWILDGVFDSRLQLHGWYIDTQNRALSCFDPASDSFGEA